MIKELVIATANREYNWIKELDNSIRISVYKKGKEKAHTLETHLGDVAGRCVHSFFSHLYLRYNSLSDYTFTAQDFPFDHVNNYIDIINGSTDDLQSKSQLYMANNIWFFNTQVPPLLCDEFGKPHHQPEILPIREIWSQLFDYTMPSEFLFAAAGHFCVNKYLVLQRPLKFYKYIVDMLENQELSPWCIERLEPYIFNPNIKIKDEFYEKD